jgi:hypothetical protein
MGQKLEGVEGLYSQPQVEQLIEVYVRAYLKLAINEVTEQLSWS